MRQIYKTASFLIFLISIPASATTYSNTSQSASKQPIEVIDVYGTALPSKHITAKKMLSLQGQFFDIYNQLAEKDEYKVLCEARAATGSHIKKRVCEPVFYKDQIREMTQLAWSDPNVMRKGVIRLKTKKYNIAMVAPKRRAQLDDMKKKLLEDPELQELFKVYNELKQTLDNQE